jgi:Mrp family chromosome partitioning ATPase
MKDLLENLSSIYDLVIVDTPPTAVVADAIPLMTQVSGVLLVSQVGRGSRDAAAHLHEQLQRLGAPTLGVVANRVKSRRGQDYYGYGYGYEGEYGAGRASETLEREGAAS